MTKIDEATVRACIEALPAYMGDYTGYPAFSGDPRKALEALLPKPVDRAVQLVEDFAADTSDAGGSALNCRKNWMLKHFARWLLARQPEPVARKEWSEEEIREAANDELIEMDGSVFLAINAAIRRGVEMGRQLAPVARKEDSYCYGYAKRLAQHLVSKHWPENKSWEALPDLEGVLSQIDNMTTGFTLKPITLTHDEIVKEAREWCGRTDPSYPWHTGEYDELPQMRHTIDLVAAWKGAK